MFALLTIGFADGRPEVVSTGVTRENALPIASVLADLQAQLIRIASAPLESGEPIAPAPAPDARDGEGRDG